MSAFETRWFKNTPISETVGNGLCAVPEALRIQPVRMNGITRRRVRRGGNLPPATFQIQPVWLNGTTPCSGDDSSPCHVPNITCADEWNHPPTCHSERTNVSRGIFPSCRFYLVSVLSATWWIPPLRFASVGMTYLRGDFVYPHRLSLQRGGRQIAAPTIHLFRIAVFLPYLLLICACKMQKQCT